MVARLLTAVAGVGIGVAPASCSGGSSSPPAAAITTWNRAAAQALVSFAGRIPVMAEEEAQWESGSMATATFMSGLAQTEALITQARAAVVRLPAYPGHPLVDRMYLATVDLYSRVAVIEMQATGIPAGALRAQVMSISDRVRELADRIFDQGRVLTSQGLTPTGVPAGTRVRLPAEVPDWVAEGLAPGPPLAPSPPPPDRYPPLRQGPRPTQAVHTWLVELREARPPSPKAVADLIQEAGQVPGRSSASRLAAEASGIQDAVTRLSSAPDPAVPDGRGLADRFRLALLVEAESCRTAEAAALLGTGDEKTAAGLATVARDLDTDAAAVVTGFTWPD